MTTTYTLTRESHKNPDKFRIRYEDATNVLGDNPPSKRNEALPIKESMSKITVVGGGFAGICVGLNLKKKFNYDDFVIFEKHSQLGGTWWANTYPGCASDIPALWYSYSDELVTNWSEIRPPQYEMEEYIQAVVKKYNLNFHARFGTSVTKAAYNDETGYWELTGIDVKTGQGFRHTTKILTNCSGGLVVPNTFKPKGIENFKGSVMHSALWDHSVDFKDKKVVVVGNGCSAAQVLPAVLDQFKPKHITQIVRTQHYIFPPIPENLGKLYYLMSFSRFGLKFIRLLVASLAELRYPMYAGNGIISRLMRWLNTKASLRYMKSTIPEKYHHMLIPKFKIGCKRLIFDYHYAPTLQDPRVDVKLGDIVSLNEKSIQMKSGETIDADIIVACTGYNLEKGFSPYEVVGRNHFNITKHWKEHGVSAYETIMPKNCPNLFFIPGPNSATGHSSVVLAIENACEFYKRVIPKILDGTYKSVCVKDEKYEEWYETTQEKLLKSVFGTKFGGCVSWYSNSKGNATAYPYSQITYYRRMKNVKWDDFDLEKYKEN